MTSVSQSSTKTSGHESLSKQKQLNSRKTGTNIARQNADRNKRQKCMARDTVAKLYVSSSLGVTMLVYSFFVLRRGVSF